MGAPLKAFGASSGAAAVLLALREMPWSPAVAIRVFAGAYLLQITGWLVYRVLIYPHFLSPLIGLPEPSQSHWLLGQFRRISKEPTGFPMMDWYVVAALCVLS